jgi:hypothetical protein
MRIMVPPSTQQSQELANIIGAARATALGGGPGGAAKVARQLGMGPGVLAIVERGAIDPVVPLTPVQQIVLIRSLANHGVFDRMLADGSFRQAPLTTPIAVVATGFLATEVDMGDPIPLSSITLDEGLLGPRQVAAICAVTAELLRATGVEGENLFSAELRSALARATDLVFVTALLSGAVDAGAVADFGAAVGAVLGALSTSAESRVYLVLPPSIAKTAAGSIGANGAMFPLLSASGGQVGSTITLVSDALPADTILAVDAHQILASGGVIALDVSKDASIQMTTTPASGPQNLVSLWQSDSIGMRGVRQFGYSVLGAGVAAKATITP